MQKSTVQPYPALISLSKVVIVILFFLLSETHLNAGEDIPFIWKGTIDVIREEVGAHPKVGTCTTIWALNVRWKETDRVNVQDEKGNVVGQFVRLQDDSSTWSGKQTGYFVRGKITTSPIYSYRMAV